MSLRRTLAVVLKELRHITRDIRTLILVFASTRHSTGENTPFLLNSLLSSTR